MSRLVLVWLRRGCFISCGTCLNFIKIFRKEETGDSEKISSYPDLKTDIAANLFITGFISSSVQLLLLKELMNITGGYELIAGAFLCSWLIGSAAGSGLAPRSSMTDLGKINLYFSCRSSDFCSFITIVIKALPEDGEKLLLSLQASFSQAWFLFRSV